LVFEPIVARQVVDSQSKSGFHTIRIAIENLSEVLNNVGRTLRNRHHIRITEHEAPLNTEVTENVCLPEHQAPSVVLHANYPMRACREILEKGFVGRVVVDQKKPLMSSAFQEVH
jgi:hypothetical protein